MSATLKTVAEKDYIEFAYNMDTIFESIKMANQLTLSGLVAQGKIKDADPYTLTNDNINFFYESCNAANESAFAFCAQLSRELKPIIPVTVFDKTNRLIKLIAGYKSTINEADLSVWDSAIQNYLIAYVLRDWYAIYIPENTAGLAEKAKALFDIAWKRSISDMRWLTVGTVEAARISLEEGFYEYIDETLTWK